MKTTLGKIVFLTTESPYPPIGGGKIRDYHLLQLLSEKHEVEVLCLNAGLGTLLAGMAAPPENVRVTVIQRERVPLWRRSIYPFRPYIVNGYSPTVESALRERASAGTLLWVSRLAMAQYIPLAKKLGFRVVLDEHNVESDLLIEAALSSLKKLPSLWYAAQCSYYESLFCRSCDALVATSAIDASKLARLAPKTDLHIIPNTIDASVFDPIRGKKGQTLLFPGTLSYMPNIEALNWFTAEVLPILQRAMGDALPRIVVAGANPSPELTRTLTQAKIEVHANPPSMLPLLADAAIVFVPLRSGSGTRLKILEAMAAGRAVVSTGKGAEGLVLSPSFDIWIADAADRFAGAILKLLQDPKLLWQVGAHAAESVRQRYDWQSTRGVMEQVLSKVKNIE